LSYDLLKFESFEELLRYLDREITRLSAKLSELSSHYARLKEKAERMKQVEEVLSKVLGEKIATMNEVDLMGVKVVIDARAVDEIKVLEEVITSTEDILNAMKKARKVLEPIARSVSSSGGIEGIDILVETVNGIPIRVLLRERAT